MITKPIPVLLMAYWVSTLRVRGRYQLAIMIGLLLCALGDILLELSEATFLFGLIAFLLGHVAYIAAFLQDNRKLCPLRAAAAYTYGLLAFGFLARTGSLGAHASYRRIPSWSTWRSSASCFGASQSVSTMPGVPVGCFSWSATVCWLSPVRNADLSSAAPS